MQLADHPRKFALSFSKESLIKSLVLAEFFFLCTTFNLFDFGGRNLLFISFTIVAGLIIVGINVRNSPSMSGGLLLLFFYLIVSFVLNITSARISSFLYSLFFLFSFWLIYSFFKRGINQQYYVSLLKTTLILYLVVLIVGQLYVTFGFFTYNAGVNAGVIHNPFGTLFEPGRSAYRFYSLSTEPSSAAFVVLVLFYSYLRNNPQRESFDRKNIPFWIMLLYMIYFFKSGYGVILFFLLLIIFFRKKENFIPFMILGTILIVIVTSLQTSAIDRVSAIIANLDISNIFSLQKIDYSASFRIVPIFHYINDINLLDPHFYFGHGSGTSSSFLIPLLFGSPVASYEGGFLPQFVYDYGIFILVFLGVFIKENVVSSFLSFEMGVIVLMMTNVNFNTQLFWFVMVSFALNKFYEKNQSARISKTSQDMV
jgi:hypothetical protein